MVKALALNPQGLDELRWQARQDGGAQSAKAAAQQFEAYFLQLMLRSMRQTLSQDGPFDSEQTRMFSGMFDQQVAQSIAQGRGLGLADMLLAQLQAQGAAAPDMPAGKGLGKPLEGMPTLPEAALKSLERSSPTRLEKNPVVLATLAQQAVATVPADEADQLEQPDPADAVAEPAEAAAAATTDTDGEAADAPLGPQNFVDTLWQHAVDAAAELGVAPQFLIAQAALESGWGRHELRHADGRNSHNLFSIKAGANWPGERVAVETAEYVNGRWERQQAEFRAYASYAEAFSDYAALLKSSPRYAGLVNQGADAQAFARGLQSGGYATDPMYADKILRVLNSATFRTRLAG